MKPVFAQSFIDLYTYHLGQTQLRFLHQLKLFKAQKRISNALYIYLCLNLSFFSGFSQNIESSFSPSGLTTKKIKLRKQDKLLSDKLPFSNIVVLDARFDTSKLGFIPNRNLFITTNKTEYQQLKLVNGVASSLQQYYNNHLPKNSSSKEFGLLIVLKKCWVTSVKPFDIQKNSPTISIHEFSRVIAKWELYIFKGDAYLPYRRIDTIIESKRHIRQLFFDEDAIDYNKENIYSILNDLIEKFDYSQAIPFFDQRAKKSLNEIIQSNNERFSLPVLLNPKQKAGVFLTFNEFKNNSPTISTFKEKKMTLSVYRVEQYIVDEKDAIINKYFAYATDGYIRVGPYGNETIFRKGNSFEFFLKKNLRPTNGNRSPIRQSQLTVWIPYQIDMETGEFY